MFLGIRSRYWWLLLATLMLGGMAAFLQVSPVFALKRTCAAGPFAEEVEKLIGVCAEGNPNIFRTDWEEIVENMLGSEKIDRVELSWRFPDGLAAEVNDFQPAALVLMKDGDMLGLDKHGRLIPFDSTWSDIDCPVIVGLACRKLFSPPIDFRVGEAIRTLEHMKEKHPLFYGTIGEMDFTDSVYIKIRTTVSHSVFMAHADNLPDQLDRLRLLCRQEDWGDEYVYDLTYDGVVIRVN